MMAIKKWFSFGRIHATTELVDTRALDADAVELAPGVVVHRKGFNRYEFLHAGQSVEVDLTLGPGEEFEPPYALPTAIRPREQFSVIHIGRRGRVGREAPCMGSILCVRRPALPRGRRARNITKSLDALGHRHPWRSRGSFTPTRTTTILPGSPPWCARSGGLTTYAVPWVRASVAEKALRLMRIDESRFHRFFDVHDLVAGAWNTIGDIEAKPVYSPHPVETTIFFFRAGQGDGRRVVRPSR